MDNIAVLLARAVAWVEVMDLNPRGRVFYPALASALVERYQFQVFPQKLEDFNEENGIKFGIGRDGDSVIEQAIIYSHGVVLETRHSTEESKTILEGAFQWAADALGLNYQGSRSIRHWQYYSQLTFNSNRINLGALNSSLQEISTRIAKAAHATTGEQLRFEPISLMIAHDPATRKTPFGAFSIQRRDNIPFGEGKYFSDAPVGTDDHIAILEKFENSFSNQRQSSLG